ncbi:MAG: tRNA 2-selenouridine(34) synthase MnmH [Ginsengibacter sp.]
MDVRSPGEYFAAHIPGAYSFPLFTDEERKVIGTAYKHKSRKDAIKIGLDVFGPNLRKMVEDAEAIATSNSKTLLVHCWRGGMRSAAVAWLLDLYGFKVYTLTGGYKAFRNWVLAQFEKDYNFKILGGYTGSGKTIIIHNLEKKKIPVIDLEKISNHKGSAFGEIGEDQQPRQEMFENKLAVELFFKSEKNTSIWLEDESQRVGAMIIPKNIWDKMRNSPVYFLDIPFEERLKYLVSTYGKYKKDELVSATMRIQKRLGGLQTKEAINYLLEDNFEASFTILLQYYDKLYSKGLQNRNNLDQLLKRISCETVTSENQIKILQ